MYLSKRLRTLLCVASLVSLGALGLAGCEPGPEDFGNPSIPNIGFDGLPVGEVDAAEYMVNYGAPPAISGGTLIVAQEGRYAVAADADLDLVYVVDLDTEKLVHTLEMDPGSEPGRLVEDAQGNVHVTARAGGYIATLDPAGGTWLHRQNVCSSPRGMAYEVSTDEVWLACAGGMLMKLPAQGGEPTLNVFVEEDLRDIVLDDGNVLVSRLKSADVLVLDRNARMKERWQPKTLETETEFDDDVTFSPSVAWRMVAHPDGGALVIHQRGLDKPVQSGMPSGYGDSGNPCSPGLVHTAVSRVIVGQEPLVANTIPGSLNVDLAVNPANKNIAIARAHTRDSAFRPRDLGVVRASSDRLAQPPNTDPDACRDIVATHSNWDEQIVAVAYAPDGTLISQSRANPGILIERGEVLSYISLGQVTPTNGGHALFHAETGSSVSCASCHPEGREDGRIWRFEGIGDRRTQPLNLGGLKGTEPLHWDGDLSNLNTLMSEVFQFRMGGINLSPVHTNHMADWLETLQPLRTDEPIEQESIERGEQVFNDPEVGCLDCHNGEKFTSPGSFPVTSEGSTQVPSLIGLSMRAPFMHTGCAPTLKSRFTDHTCGGGDRHGKVSHLNEREIDDLVAYLKQL